MAKQQKQQRRTPRLMARTHDGHEYAFTARRMTGNETKEYDGFDLWERIDFAALDIEGYDAPMDADMDAIMACLGAMRDFTLGRAPSEMGE